MSGKRKRVSVSKLRKQKAGSSDPENTRRDIIEREEPNDTASDVEGEDSGDNSDDPNDFDAESDGGCNPHGKQDADDDHVDDWLDTKKQRKSQDSGASSSSSAKKSSNTDAEESKSSIAGASSDLCNDRTIYIEGLPYAASEQDIRDFFEPCGYIQNIRLPRWHDSGRLRGYGHVEFISSKSVKKALELDGCDLKGRYVKVARPLVPRVIASTSQVETGKIVRPAGCRSVFVKNIPYDSAEADVREAFMVCGPIVNVRLAVWGNTKQLKGFGYVDFKREDSAEIAVKKSGKLTVKGRPVIVDFETGAPKKSFKKIVPEKKAFNAK